MDARFENACYAACAVVLAAFFGTHAFDARLKEGIGGFCEALKQKGYDAGASFTECVAAAQTELEIYVWKHGHAHAHALLHKLKQRSDYAALRGNRIMDVTYARVLREMWEEKYGAGGGQQRAANGARQSYQGEAGDFHNTIPPATTTDYNDFESRMTAEINRRRNPQ